MNFTTQELLVLNTVLWNMSGGFKQAIEKHYDYLAIMNMSVNEYGIESYQNSIIKNFIEKLMGKIYSHRAKLITRGKMLIDIDDLNDLMKYIRTENILNLDKDVLKFLQMHQKLANVAKEEGISEIRYNAYALLFEELNAAYGDCIYILERCINLLEDEIKKRKDLDIDKISDNECDKGK